MPSVGEILRRERERQGLDLSLIAEQTRIKRQYLEALERDDFQSLPGAFFARSFTTQYASRLGIENPELKEALQRQVAPVEVDLTQLQRPNAMFQVHQEPVVDPLPEGTASAITARKMTSSLVMLAAAIIACGAIFWLWQRSQLSSTSANATEATTPVGVPDNVSPPAAQPVVKEPVAAALPPQNAPPVEATSVETTPVAATPASATPAVTPQDTAAAGKINLSIVAKEDTWIRLTADGKIVSQRVLVAGESREASANEMASLLLGNAGGVDIRYNGNSIGQVGPRGQVRTVEFFPERFNVIQPPPKIAPASPASETKPPA